MKYSVISLLLIALFFLFSAESCDRSATAVKTIKAASFLLGTKDTTTTVKWRKISRFDPYNEGQLRSYEDYKTTLTLQGNGNYTEKDPENVTLGQYYLNKTKNAIAFVPLEINGQSQEKTDSPPLFRHEIVKFSADSLILEWQGRHGMVKEVYVRIRE